MTTPLHTSYYSVFSGQFTILPVDLVKEGAHRLLFQGCDFAKEAVASYLEEKTSAAYKRGYSDAHEEAKKHIASEQKRVNAIVDNHNKEIDSRNAQVSAAIAHAFADGKRAGIEIGREISSESLQRADNEINEAHREVREGLLSMGYSVTPAHAVGGDTRRIAPVPEACARGCRNACDGSCQPPTPLPLESNYESNLRRIIREEIAKAFD